MKSFRVDIGVPESHGITITVKARNARSAYSKAIKAMKINDGNLFEKNYEIFRIFDGKDVCYDYLAGFI